MSMSNLIETFHPLSADERPAEQAALAAIGAYFANATGTMRDAYDNMTAHTPVAAGVTTERVDSPETQGWWVRPEKAANDRAVLFVHGGAYMLGSAKAYRGFASQIAVRSGVSVFVLDYPLAPEHPFPAAFDAAAAAPQWLKAQGYPQIALAGDSAGGAMVLASLAVERLEWPSVSAVIVFSPWVDLTLSGPSLLDPDTHDPVFKPEILAAAVDKYLAGADPRDDRASPLFAIPDSLPPLAIQVGTDELLLDDARRYAAAAATRGGEVRLDIYDGLHHVFQRSTEELPSAGNALDAAAQFLSDHWH
ncbi:alpha/beta hydrolase fold domain-containing protein [Rhizobium tumorigenes]|uniref:Alpha/beta hydrolase n=1 Tax=Rhizobium tumorigenes TaxID=2041385 RepID=A0AAF1K870_9HYPH|nr:alpha/beta hydrolase [Rhizobium tumorigenes]WFR94097.1 alpha/beta hydrolase [Rhizobium tumorigenes]